MKRFGTGTLLLALGLALGACDDSTGGETGSLSILLTDEQGDVLEAWVTIDRIYLVGGMVNPEASEPGANLMTDPVTVDLVTLDNAIEGLVDGAEVPTGHYAQLRVVVSDACIVVEGASADVVEVYATPGFTQCDRTGVSTGTLETPSLDETGIKVLFEQGGVSVTGGQQVWLLDFDVSQSYGHAAAGAGWVMTPVIRGGDIGLTASVTVNLALAEGSALPAGTSFSAFVAELSTEPEEQSFADEDGDGTYSVTFEHIVPDAEATYTVSVTPPTVSGHTITVDPAEAQADVLSGQDAVVNVTVTVEATS